MKTQKTDLACDLTVLRKEEKQQLALLTDTLFAAVQETREIENGFAFRFINEPGQLVQIAEFIESESQCCPFLNFRLKVEALSGPVWLQISGEAGTKEFLQAELDHMRSLELA